MLVGIGFAMALTGAIWIAVKTDRAYWSLFATLLVLFGAGIIARYAP